MGVFIYGFINLIFIKRNKLPIIPLIKLYQFKLINDNLIINIIYIIKILFKLRKKYINKL